MLTDCEPVWDKPCVGEMQGCNSCSGSLSDSREFFSAIKSDIISKVTSGLHGAALGRYVLIRLNDLLSNHSAMYAFIDKESDQDAENNCFSLIDFMLGLDIPLEAPIMSPAPYAVYFKKQRSQHSSLVRKQLSGFSLPSYLVARVISYLDQIEKGKYLTFYALQYYHNFLNAFRYAVTPVLSEKIFFHTLFALNFNDLQFFDAYITWSESQLALLKNHEKLDWLAREKCLIPVINGAHPPGCYPAFPHICTMIHGFFAEKIKALEVTGRVIDASPVTKLCVELPVAQIALLLKVFYQSGIFGGLTLTQLFRTTCSGISSKRQPSISKASISKEFYSISQVTAARTIDILEKMITKIRHDFFPA